MTRGIIMYHTGRKLAVRLAVALHTLRKYYSGPVTLLSEGKQSWAICEPLAEKYFIDLENVEFPTHKTRGTVFVNATLVGNYTPYDVTVWLDVDTLTQGDFWNPMWWAAEESDFAVCQISNWLTGGKISKRIRAWEAFYPEWIEGAINGGKSPAINCGLFSFARKAKLMRKWYKIVKPVLSDNRGVSMRYPDESCCQLILHRYKHKIMDQRHNYSCKYGIGDAEDATMVHYHGSKHCRIKLDPRGCPLYEHNSMLWYNAFDEIRDTIPSEWIQWDHQLKQNLGKHDAG